MKSINIKDLKIESATPEYTGGNIYLFTGKLQNGNYFLMDGDMFDVRIVDAPIDEDWEISQFPDWQEQHLVVDLAPADALRFCAKVIRWVKANKPDGNYLLSDMDYIAEDLAECIKAEASGKAWY